MPVDRDDVQEAVAQQLQTAAPGPVPVNDVLQDPLAAQQLGDPLVGPLAPTPQDAQADPQRPAGPLAPGAPEWAGDGGLIKKVAPSENMLEAKKELADGSEIAFDGSTFTGKTDADGVPREFSYDGENVAYEQELMGGGSASAQVGQDGVKVGLSDGELANQSYQINFENGAPTFAANYANENGNGAILGRNADGSWTGGLNARGTGISTNFGDDMYDLKISRGGKSFAAQYGQNDNGQTVIGVAGGGKKLGGSAMLAYGNDQTDASLGANYKGVGIHGDYHSVYDRMDYGQNQASIFGGREVTEIGETNELGGGGGIGASEIAASYHGNGGSRKAVSRLRVPGEEDLTDQERFLLAAYDVERLEALPDDVQDLDITALNVGEAVSYEDYDQYAIDVDVNIADQFHYDYDRQGSSSEKTTVANMGDAVRVQREQGWQWASTHDTGMRGLSETHAEMGAMQHESVMIQADASDAEALEAAQKFARTGLLPGAEDVEIEGVDVEAMMEQVDVRIQELEARIASADDNTSLRTHMDNKAELRALYAGRTKAIEFLNQRVEEKFNVGEEIAPGVVVQQASKTEQERGSMTQDHWVYADETTTSTARHAEAHVQADGTVGTTITADQTVERDGSYMLGMIEGTQQDSRVTVQASNAQGADGLVFRSSAAIERDDQLSTASRAANSTIALDADAAAMAGKDLVTTVNLSQEDLADIASRFNAGDGADAFWSNMAREVAAQVDSDLAKEEILKIDSPEDFAALPAHYQRAFVNGVLGDLEDSNPFQAIAAIELMAPEDRPDVYASMVQSVHEEAPDGDVGTLYNQFVQEMEQDEGGQALAAQLEERASVQVSDKATRLVQQLDPATQGAALKRADADGILKILEAVRGQGGAAQVQAALDASGWSPQQFAEHFFAKGGDVSKRNRAMDLLHGTYYGEWFQDALDALDAGESSAEVTRGEHSRSRSFVNAQAALDGQRSAAEQQTDRWGRSLRRHMQAGGVGAVASALEVLQAARAKGGARRVQAVLDASEVPPDRFLRVFVAGRGDQDAARSAMGGTAYGEKLWALVQAYRRR